MKKKERRIRFLLQLFFLLTGIVILLFKAYPVLKSLNSPNNLFILSEGDLPIFNFIIHFISGLSCLIAAWALWVKADWDKGWGMFTFGLLLYGSLNSMTGAIYHNPVQVIPLVIIILVVLQGFSFMIKQSDRYH